MIENIISGIIANVSFAVILISFGWILYWFTTRRKLLRFFNIKTVRDL